MNTTKPKIQINSPSKSSDHFSLGENENMGVPTFQISPNKDMMGNDKKREIFRLK